MQTKSFETVVVQVCISATSASISKCPLISNGEKHEGTVGVWDGASGGAAGAPSGHFAALGLKTWTVGFADGRNVQARKRRSRAAARGERRVGSAHDDTIYIYDLTTPVPFRAPLVSSLVSPARRRNRKRPRARAAAATADDDDNDDDAACRCRLRARTRTNEKGRAEPSVESTHSVQGSREKKGGRGRQRP